MKPSKRIEKIVTNKIKSFNSDRVFDIEHFSEYDIYEILKAVIKYLDEEYEKTNQKD